MELKHEHPGVNKPQIGPLDAAKDIVKAARREFALVTRSLRSFPDYLIIGAQKGGTNSLYNYLRAHPDITGATRREVRYFAANYRQGPDWYRGHFQTRAYAGLMRLSRGVRPLAGESTPDYLFHPPAAARVAALLPDVRLIALLRNPVDRAYSHYRHRVRYCLEGRRFEDTLEEEFRAAERMLSGRIPEQEYETFEYMRQAYLARGLYALQLERWFQYFSRDQLLILKSEDMFEHPVETYERVLAFLGRCSWRLGEMTKYNSFGESRRLDPRTRELLAEFFAPHNRRLEELTGMKFGWI